MTLYDRLSPTRPGVLTLSFFHARLSGVFQHALESKTLLRLKAGQMTGRGVEYLATGQTGLGAGIDRRLADPCVAGNAIECEGIEAVIVQDFPPRFKDAFGDTLRFFERGSAAQIGRAHV